MTLASVQLYGYIKVLRGFTFGGEAMGFAVGGCSEGLGDNYINSLTPPVGVSTDLLVLWVHDAINVTAIIYCGRRFA